jgi:hypothetical protein
MAEYKWSIVESEKHCLFCRSNLFHLTPLNEETKTMFETWEYYCPRCEKLVIPLEDFDPTIPEGAAGKVVAIHLKLTIIPKGVENCWRTKPGRSRER